MKHTVEVKRKAHFYHSASKNELNGIVVAIHGYAQLAEKFIKEFDKLTEHNLDVYAPEAISKFYGRERKPVASWMTSHEREDEIEDYTNFIETVMKQIPEKHKSLPLYLIGFSQGVSTLLRWYNKSNINAQQIHLIAGSIPEELNTDHDIHADQVLYYYGDNDRLVKREQIESYLQRLNSLKIDYTFIEFEGRHEIPEKLLNHLCDL